MAGLIDELVNTMSQENDIYRELIPIAEEKTRVIIKNDLDALQKITEQEQLTIEKINALEKKREEVVINIGTVLSRDPKELNMKALIKIMGKQPEEQMGELKKYFRAVEIVDSFDDIPDEPIKISFFTPDGDAAEKIYPLFAKYYDSMQVVLASAYWVDVTNKGANKGMAVKALQTRLGLKPEECAVFGDYMNDLEMMGAAYYSYAMENAYPPVKEAARFVAPSNAEHGVMKTIRGFIEQGLC